MPDLCRVCLRLATLAGHDARCLYPRPCTAADVPRPGEPFAVRPVDEGDARAAGVLPDA